MFRVAVAADAPATTDRDRLTGCDFLVAADYPKGGGNTTIVTELTGWVPVARANGT